MSNLPSTSNPPSVSGTSTGKTRQSVENLRKIKLIGKTTHQITGAKLPSNKQVLQVFFYNMRFVKLSSKESAKITISAVIIFWQQARYEARCVEKLEKEYDTWKKIQKTVPSKRTPALQATVNTFIESLDDLFDIATSNALETIRIEEDKQFLIKQRQKGRPGCMIGVDMKLYEREKRTRQRKEKEELRKRKHNELMNKSSKLRKFIS